MLSQEDKPKRHLSAHEISHETATTDILYLVLYSLTNCGHYVKTLTSQTAACRTRMQ